MPKKPTYEELEQRVKELEGQKSGDLELDLVALFQGFKDSFPVGITDHQGVILYVNNALGEMWGYSSPEDTIGRQLAEFWEGPGIYRTMEDLAAKGWSMGEDIGKRKDGSLFPVDYKAIMCTDFDGKPIYMLGQFVDISEKKRAEESLRESEEKYRLLVENVNDIIYSTDVGGVVTYISPAVENLMGYVPSEIIGRNFVEFVHPDDRHKILERFREIQESNILRPHEYRLLSKSGEVHWIRSSSQPIFENEQVAGLRGIYTDITESKDLEAQLQRAQKMEAMGLMAGGVAHDLNNILSGIVSYPELLLMDLPEDSPLRNPIKTIQESGMRAADVVEDLLTIARGVASGKEVVNLNTVVEEYLNSAEHQKLEKIHPLSTFKTELDSELFNITCSASHVKKVLMNLIVNASEAIEGRGTVTVSTINRYLDEPLKGYEDVHTGEYVVLGVSDDGSGISPQDLDRIFEPFYTKKVMGRSGTGLGLAVVWNSMQDHDGYINVNTSEKGTVFELYFPVTRKDVSDKKEKTPFENYLGHGEKILVVDDEERQRVIACGLLTRLGYNPEAVSSGEESIEYVKENAVDLIVLDMVMPKGINGRETYQQIIKIRPGQKAVIASGYAKTKEVDMAQELGAGKYIKKPYTLEKIGVAVKKELEK
jgi:two-component system, cell cycle sensor histidine kinase and response regulator CckA